MSQGAVVQRDPLSLPTSWSAFPDGDELPISHHRGEPGEPRQPQLRRQSALTSGMSWVVAVGDVAPPDILHATMLSRQGEMSSALRDRGIPCDILGAWAPFVVG